MSAHRNRINHVLVVDDIYDNLILIESILEDEGYRINLATDGFSALATIEQDPPDLVLLDVMMPEMHGYEVTRRIRQNEKLSYIPILLVTAHDQTSAVEGLDAGADDFIRKPFDTDELLARVRSLLRLKHSIDEREEMLRQREDFVSRLTHDLRIPLVAADRMLHLFLQEAYCPLSDDMKEAVGVVIRNNQNLLQMVNTLLEVYRHEAGQKKLTLVPCDVKEICQEIVQELNPLAWEKELAIVLLSPANPESKDEPIQILADRLELRRVFSNLLGNAIKFTDQGSINVSIVKAPPKDKTLSSKDWVAISVRDTGSGIPPEDQAVIFERFRQGRNRRADSGLGLYLTRRIVEAHQGFITVESKVGQGSVFTVYLPANP
ncbi:MAG: hybrid sensor histidine kinase/response regulator [Oscillatoriales cyanobacterium C42_A2020_001]|nr:hybrid sensor histidine kinase/response regulator [Leptolyngbyaceae cyanobacterium C42_A2020_001]